MRPVLSVRLLTLIVTGLAGASLQSHAPFAVQAAAPPAAHRVAHPRLLESYGRLPLHFESNQGQVDPQVKFLARGSGYSLFLTPTEAVLALRERGTSGPAVLRMKLAGANPSPHVTGGDELSGKTNYFVGNDPARWRTNVPNYARVHYRGVYPGIDLVYYGNQGQLEYDFVVAPGADPDRITMSFDGARDIQIDPSGDLILHVAGGELRQHKPVVYQEAQGVRQEVAGRYVIAGNRLVGFALGIYDETRPLVIDPVLVYSTYLGGDGDDHGNDIAADAAGNAYVTGQTDSLAFPGGAADPTPDDSIDAFVAKLNPTGSALVYLTYLGGDLRDVGNGIAVDTAGNAYVAGSTLSSDFPVSAGAFDTTPNGQDAFVAKLNFDGSTLQYATFLGGSNSDLAYDVAVDAADNAYVTGQTYSSNFPISLVAFQLEYRGEGDAFVTKLNSNGTAALYSTYLGGGADESGNGIAVDTTGNAHVTGQTFSEDFPTQLAVQPAHAGAGDAFVTKLNETGSAPLLYSTYLGGSAIDSGNDLAVDTTGNAYVTGSTASDDFTEANTADYRGGNDVFVTKLPVAGVPVVYSIYLGGAENDIGNAIAVDIAGSAYVTGQTSSSDFPSTLGEPPTFDTTLGGTVDAFFTQLDTAGSTTPLYSRYLGGDDPDFGRGIAVDAAGNAFVTGWTQSIANFQMTTGAYQEAFNGGTGDAFVTKIGGFVLPPASLTLDPLTDTNPVGSEHCVTATVQDAAGHPMLGVTVHFEVDANGAVVASGSGTTNANGQAEFCYTGPGTPRIDAISAYADTNEDSTQDAGEPEGGATKIWVAGPPATLMLTPPEDTNPVGSKHCVIATVEDAFGNPLSGVTVRFAVAGAVTTSGVATTDANGQAPFCYSGPVLPGADSISAYADANNDGGPDAGEPWGAATKTWVAPPQTCGEVEGKGVISVHGGLAGFWFEVEQGGPGTAPQGKLIYLARHRYFRSTQITELVITGDKATIHGLGRVNNGPVVLFQVDITEGHPDRFAIQWPGYAAAGHVWWGDIDIDQGCHTGH